MFSGVELLCAILGGIFWGFLIRMYVEHKWPNETKIIDRAGKAFGDEAKEFLIRARDRLNNSKGGRRF